MEETERFYLRVNSDLGLWYHIFMIFCIHSTPSEGGLSFRIALLGSRRCKAAVHGAVPCLGGTRVAWVGVVGLTVRRR